MRLGSIYLIVKNFAKSIEFYEKLLEMPVSKKNMDRFAMFNFDGQCISIMNAYFDTHNPDKVICLCKSQNVSPKLYYGLIEKNFGCVVQLQ